MTKTQALKRIGTAETDRAVAMFDLRAAVREARDTGCTWKEIGDILETSPQAAQQRFSDPV